MIVLAVNVLASEKITVVTTYKWEPFNIIINGKLEGIGIDFWKITAKKAGIDYKFKIVENWVDVLKNIKNGTAALTVSTDCTEDRKNYAVFSKPYVTYPLVIATRDDVGFIFNVESLKDKKIAIGKNYTAAKMMVKKYPDLEYVYVKSLDEALHLVNQKKVFAAVDILPVIAYKINKYENRGLKISGQIPLDFKVRFMLSKKFAYLLPKINSAIDTITYEQKEQIYNKYVSPAKRYMITSNELVFYILIAVSFLLIIALWIYSIKNELNDLKKVELNRYNQDCDRLSGIFNRKKALSVIRGKIINKEKFSVIMFDIKNFKSINKFYGHHFGDIALLELVSLIKSLLKEDEFFARIKGGTFAIISTQIEIDACKRAKEIYEAVEKFEFSIVKELKCRFAVKTFYEDETPENVLDKMEKEIIKAKNSSKDFIC